MCVFEFLIGLANYSTTSHAGPVPALVRAHSYLEVIRDCKRALKIANDSHVIKSYVVEKSDGSGTGGAEQVHLPRLKFDLGRRNGS